LGAVDALIAGIALENREELLTRNARDFPASKA
jgi:predicted nucleic acid-binding protein